MTRGRYNVDLVGHLAECDANYLRLMKLLPHLDDENERCFVLVLGERQVLVRLVVLERCPYTSVVRVSQPSTGNGTLDRLTPALTVRLYHDARSAEVVEYQNERRFKAVYTYPNREMRHRDEKVQINRLLGEYLSICLSHGAAVGLQHVVIN